MRLFKTDPAVFTLLKLNLNKQAGKSTKIFDY